jgi:hypothetical protein
MMIGVGAIYWRNLTIVGVQAPVISAGSVMTTWWQTSFTVPSDWAGQNVILNFGAVDYEATVFINVSGSRPAVDSSRSTSTILMALVGPKRDISPRWLHAVLRRHHAIPHYERDERAARLRARSDG